MSDNLSCKLELKTQKRPLFGEVSRAKLEHFFVDDNDFLMIENDSVTAVFKEDITQIVVFTDSESIIINKLTGELGVV